MKGTVGLFSNYQSGSNDQFLMFHSGFVDLA